MPLLEFIMGVAWSKSDEQYLLNNYQLVKIIDIAKKLGRTKFAIKSKARKLGIKLEDDVKKKRYTMRKQKFYVNSNFFKHPQNELLVGYLMGFIWADGYVSKKNNAVSVYIASDDAADLKSLFLLSGEWRIYNKIPKCGKNLTRIGCHCFELHQFLVENNYLNKSFSSPSFLKNKSIEFKKGFWRGYIDGDGCFHFNPKTRKKTISMAGSKTQDWSDYFQFLEDLGCKYTLQINKRCSQVYTRDAKSILKIIAFIYEDTYDNIGLKRKFDKAKGMKKYIIELMNKNKHLYK